MPSSVPTVALENLGPGPSPVSLDELSALHDFLVVFLQRDHHCTNCRRQVQSVADRVDSFRERNAEPVSVVPESSDLVRKWQQSYTLPYPLLADPDAIIGEALGQPVRFGPLGNWSDFLGRMPLVAIIDGRGDSPRIAYSTAGRSTFDRPSIDDLLEQLDSIRATTP
ncbi:MAG: redoxin domain-containing protein [Salinirussus sp.]